MWLYGTWALFKLCNFDANAKKPLIALAYSESLLVDPNSMRGFGYSMFFRPVRLSSRVCSSSLTCLTGHYAVLLSLMMLSSMALAILSLHERILVLVINCSLGCSKIFYLDELGNMLHSVASKLWINSLNTIYLIILKTNKILF